MSETANQLKGNAKDGSFEVDAAPNPHALVIEHSKTLITIAAAFIGLTATFSEKLLGESPETYQKWVFGAMWFFILLGMLCGIRTMTLLHRFLFWPESNPSDPKSVEEANAKGQLARRRSAIWGNVGLWNLFFAGIMAASLAVAKVCAGGKPLDANKCIRVCMTYLDSFPGMGQSNWTLEKMEWNQTNKLFNVTLQIPRSSTAFALTVDAKEGTVLSAKRLSFEMGKDILPSSSQPFVITNFVQIPTITNVIQMSPITNLVQMGGVTNVVQIPAISNFVQIPAITNIFQSPTQSTRIRRWGVGIGIGSER